MLDGISEQKGALMFLNDLLTLEHEGWDSLCTGNGGSFYGRTMTRDGIMVLSHGQALGRDEVIASLAAAPPWESYDIAGAKLITLTSTSAILTYTGSAQRTGDTIPFRALMSTVYVHEDGRWRIALYQQTPIPG